MLYFQNKTKQSIQESRNNTLPNKKLQKHLLDSWQEDAIQHLDSGCNVIVDAPTTSGKTKIAEEFFRKNLKSKSFRACYTCPVKSLSNDKLREFRNIFGKEYVGIATGDFKENLDAPIVVSTLETYRNSLLGIEPDLGRTLIIFDEYHFMQDSMRGSAWEESLILTPKDGGTNGVESRWLALALPSWYESKKNLNVELKQRWLFFRSYSRTDPPAKWILETTGFSNRIPPEIEIKPQNIY